jgi:hypothetical protein
MRSTIEKLDGALSLAKEINSFSSLGKRNSREIALQRRALRINIKDLVV